MFNGKKVIALIQARCTSIRLPKKHFRTIGDRMLIDWVVDRLKEIKEIDEIIISTTNNSSDMVLKEYAEKKNIEVYCDSGDINDVVGRHYNALKTHSANNIIVISGDCPLIDKKIIYKQLQLLSEGYDYCRPLSSCIHEGIDSYSLKCIEFIKENSITAYEKENFGVIIRENPKLAKIGYFSLEEKYVSNKFRISVDTRADLKFMNILYKKLSMENKFFSLDNVLDLVKKNESLLEINACVQQKKKDEKTYQFLIKTEASEEKGLGHIKRMMALGQYLNESRNNGVYYAVNQDKMIEKLLRDKAYIYDYCFSETEAEIIDLINSLKVDFLIIDMQKLEKSKKYNFENIKKRTQVKKIILIDSYIENDFVDLMLFQGIQSDIFEEKVKGNNKVIYGLESVFINTDFIEAKKEKEKRKRETKKKEKKIIVSFGGSDPRDLTIDIIKELNHIKNNDIKFNLKIILGPYYNHEDQLLEELKRSRYKYEIVKNPVSFANELITCDFGIIAFGVSFYEFLYMGIPTLNYSLNDSDSEIIKKIERKHWGLYKNKNSLNLQKLYAIEIKNINKIGDIENLYWRMTNE